MIFFKSKNTKIDTEGYIVGSAAYAFYIYTRHRIRALRHLSKKRKSMRIVLRNLMNKLVYANSSLRARLAYVEQ